jgi:dihydroorotate dehydrogenase
MVASGEILGVGYEGIPFGPGPGAVNGTNLDQILGHFEDLCRSPAGVLYYGSLTWDHNWGNRGETYFFDPQTGEAVNAMALPNLGVDLATPVIAEVSRMCADAGKALIVSVSTKAGENAEQVLPGLVGRAFDAGAPIVEVNYSCPNIVQSDGSRKPLIGFDPEAMNRTRRAIMTQVPPKARIIEKLPPYLGENAHLVDAVASTYSPEVAKGVGGVAGFNTIPGVTLYRNGRPVIRAISNVDGEEVVIIAGGLSGPAQADTMYELQQEFGAKLPRNIEFVAANGVHNGAEVLRRTQGGACPAVAAVAVSAFWEGEKAGRSFGRTASQFAQEYAEALAA